MSRSLIAGYGSYLPSHIMTNDDLSEQVDTSHDWIVERTGITQRHIAAEDEHTSDLATQAAKNALDNAGLNADDIDLIIVATTTPDKVFPSTATLVQHKLGIRHGAAFDIQAVCSGFIYALSVADNLLKSGQYKHALVIGAETMSRIIDWTDRNTCILFGDGAGAVILQASTEETSRGILSTHLYSDGHYHDILHVNGGPSLSRSSGVIEMQGRDVFKHAVDKMYNSVLTSLSDNNLQADDLNWVIPHQANKRIIDAITKKMGIDAQTMICSVPHHANTSAASIPLAITHAHQSTPFKPGDLIALTALGGGLTWGSALLRW